MEYQSKRQLQSTFELTHSDITKIINENNLKMSYRKGRATYYKLEVVKPYIKKYREFQIRYKTISAMTQKYVGVSRDKIENLIMENEIKPAYIEGRYKLYDLNEMDLLIRKWKERRSDDWLTILGLTKKFEFSCSKTTKEILDYSHVSPVFKEGSTVYYDVNEVADILMTYKRSLTPCKLSTVYGISVGTVNKLIEYNRITPSYTTVNKGVTYYDIKIIEPLILELKYAQENWKTIKQIHKDNDIHDGLLSAAIQGYGIKPKYIKYSGIRYFDEQQVLKAYLDRAKSTNRKRSASRKDILTYYERLHLDFQKMIEAYIKVRKSGKRIRSNFYVSKKRTIAHQHKEILRIRRVISSVLYKIAVNRMKSLSEGVGGAVKFDIYDLNGSDIIPLQNDFTNSTLFNYCVILLPFLSYLLQEERKKGRNNGDMETYYKIEEGIEEFIDQFPYDYNDGDKTPLKKHKSFLTREQCIDVYNLLLTDPRSVFALKNATIWQMSCITGIRPEELSLLCIEDFLLDNEGFLTTNKKGWGWVFVRKEVSKMEQSPSSHECKTPIPANIVDDINMYLKVLYKKQGSLVEKGKGYFFRPQAQLPEVSYGPSGLSKTPFRRITQFLDFLTTEQQQDFQLKTGRHSLNTLFVESYNIMPEEFRNWKLEKARQHQMRHQGDAQSEETQRVQQAKTGQNHYTKDITAEEYYAILEQIITFPWEQKRLILWEIDKGYRKPETPINIEFDNESEKMVFDGAVEEKRRLQQQSTDKVLLENKEELSNLQNRLKLIEQRLIDIKQAPKDDQDFEAWIKERASLKKEKREIQSYLQY